MVSKDENGEGYRQQLTTIKTIKTIKTLRKTINYKRDFLIK